MRLYSTLNFKSFLLRRATLSYAKNAVFQMASIRDGALWKDSLRIDNGQVQEVLVLALNVQGS